MAGVHAPRLQLRRRVRKVVERIARQREAPHAVVIRAKIVMDAVAGFSNAENARRNGVNRTTVERWRGRMEAVPKAATLVDAPRSGRPPRIPLIVRSELLKLACARPKPEESIERAEARHADAKEAHRAGVARAALAEKDVKEKAKFVSINAKQITKASVTAASARSSGDKVRVVETGASVAALKAERKARRKALAKAERKLARANKKLNAASIILATADKDLARARTGAPVPFSAVWNYTTLQQELVRQTGHAMSLSEVGRTLRCGGLRPHRIRIWLHSPDPDFQNKAKAVCDLYLSPPPKATVLCFDEKPGMQALEKRHATHCAMGENRSEFEYIRHGTSTLLAAFNVKTGEVFGECRRRNAAGVLKFFHELARKYPTGDVYIVLDNLNVHKGAAVEQFIAQHGGRFHFVYTPLHASWMNQVEVWFGILQRGVLRYSSFTSKRELEAAVLSFIRHWNRDRAHPFRWRFRGTFERPELPWAA